MLAAKFRTENMKPTVQPVPILHCYEKLLDSSCFKVFQDFNTAAEVSNRFSRVVGTLFETQKMHVEGSI